MRITARRAFARQSRAGGCGIMDDHQLFKVMSCVNGEIAERPECRAETVDFKKIIYDSHFVFTSLIIKSSPIEVVDECVYLEQTLRLGRSITIKSYLKNLSHLENIREIARPVDIRYTSLSRDESLRTTRIAYDDKQMPGSVAYIVDLINELESPAFVV
ncbi:hypothetical protein EVAR_56642_1 [Eumeta japonica]|uniref:Uncharacterized protein n=1 Tax=Eumeta variegata TaxID=151549 RepID=A0A4C1YX98_EUMVA|nr:hypothetical protein EVAR_56642_1 [Eumeta japonica]